jgi:NTP pyrophosphatase (non-canonical NTP hydrolase)
MRKLISNVEQWAVDRNLIKGSTPLKQVNKTSEELNELVAALGAIEWATQPDGHVPPFLMNNAADAIGDVTVTLIIIAKQLGLDFETCLDMAYEEIKDRKGKMVNGVFLKDTA